MITDDEVMPTNRPSDKLRALSDAFARFRVALDSIALPQADGSRKVTGVGGAVELSAAAEALSDAAARLVFETMTNTRSLPKDRGSRLEGRETDTPGSAWTAIPPSEIRMRAFRIGEGGLNPTLVEIQSRLASILGFPADRWNQMQARNPGANHQRFLVNDTLSAADLAVLESVKMLLQAASGYRNDLATVAHAFERALNDPMMLLAVHDAVDRFFIMFSQWRVQCAAWREKFAERETKWALYGGHNPTAQYIPSRKRGFQRDLKGPASPLGLDGKDFGKLPPEEQAAIDAAILLTIRDNDESCQAVGHRMPPVADELAYLMLMDHASKIDVRVAQIRLDRVMAWLPQAAEVRKNRSRTRLRGDKSKGTVNSELLAQRMRVIVEESPESRKWTVKQWATRLKCSTGRVSGLAPWKAIVAARRSGKAAPITRLSDKALANISTEGKVGRKISQTPNDTELTRLIREQEQDAMADARTRSRNERSDDDEA